MEQNKNIGVWIIAALAFLFVVGSYGRTGYGMMGLGMGLGGLFMVLFWGVFIWLVATLVKQSQHNTIQKDEGALDILKKRYAKGELTRKQYEEMKRELE